MPPADRIREQNEQDSRTPDKHSRNNNNNNNNCELLYRYPLLCLWITMLVTDETERFRQSAVPYDSVVTLYRYLFHVT